MRKDHIDKSTLDPQFVRKLSNTEAELKKSVAYKKSVNRFIVSWTSMVNEATFREILLLLQGNVNDNVLKEMELALDWLDLNKSQVLILTSPVLLKQV